MKFGIIGAGSIAVRFVDTLKGLGITPYAVASRDLDKAKRFKAAHGVHKAYGSYEALFNDDAIECVYIATPHNLHYPQMLEALEHHKPILCEKPFTLNEWEASEVFKKAASKNIFVMEAMKTRFLPILEAVRIIIEEGDIGAIKKIEATFSSTSGQLRLFDPALGGGALLDIGVYPLNLFAMFLGTPTTFESNVTIDENGIDTEETIHYKTKTAEGILQVSLLKELSKDATIYGTKGRIELPHYSSGEKAFVYDSKGTLQKTLEKPHRVDGFEYQIEAAIQCIREGKTESSIMSHATTLTIMRMMDNLRKTWNMTYPGEQK